ncbi:MAG: phosphoribosylaminoimidazolesuccinocarboxamide synthase [Propionibacteriaceae bacterium]|nr:phosphoribosylaminoimidazolesuccinocarboxamide synthase [Propionibacteriaceae bacterium]
MSQYSTLLGKEPIHVGKVRELFDWDDGTLLMVATDNISAFDYVLDSVIPDKGKVLTELSLWWFEQIADVTANHVISDAVPEAVAGRAVIVEKLDMVPVECIARGYLTGTGWAEYQVSQTVCGIPLPAGLHDGSKLPEPIFTPSTKAEIGVHDENISYQTMVDTLTGPELGAQIRDTTLAVYSRAEALAATRGIILADTKFEFGRRADGTLVLGDEVLTPDSSRFWDAGDYAQGKLTSFDKQFLRNWLTQESGWDKASGTTPPPLPEHIIAATRARYIAAYEQLTGKAFVA